MSITIALTGNPNSGKTTLFNALTGSNQFVGNWPGVTVEKKEGRLKGQKNVIITDLPGIYSLSPYTLEEVVARNYLINEKPDAILNIVDGSNLERNLYLTTQLTELGIPVVMAVNMMDVVNKNGDTINFKNLSKALGCEVVSISALKGTGIKEAAAKAVEAAKSGKKLVPAHNFSKEAEGYIAEIAAKLTDAAEEQKRFYAIKLFERDDKIGETLKSVPDVSDVITRAEEEMDDDTESIITNERYTYISSIISGCLKKKGGQKLSTSDKIDKIVTNRILALPIFAVVMFIVYYISVTTVGTIFTDWANDGVFGDGWHLFGSGVWIPGIPVIIENALGALGTADWLSSLILDGIVAGVGSVLGFVPQMLVLFIFLAFLESCGYMARIAFIMDRIFKRFGLSGKSFIPILIGTGCGVPGIMASRTIENERDRRMTIMTTTFIPCGA
ncbi:MAG: ferrous iron transport protein B, partial [Clostridiales bacterium]|nr:ferrous iron transport protein B [Clostridiales bacterium]